MTSLDPTYPGAAAARRPSLAAIRAAVAGPRTTRLGARSWSARETLAASGAVAAMAALAALSWLAAGLVVPWDSKNHFYAMFRFVGGALSRGEIPLWNPYHFAGHPAVADPQSLIFTPSLALVAALAPTASMQAFDLVILAHLLLGGLCILAICRRRGHEPVAAVLAAIIFMAGGAASSRLQHTGMIVSYAFFPLALLALESLIEKGRLRDAVGFGLAATLMALGRDQVAFLFCLVLVLRFVHATICAARPLAFLRRRIAPLALGGTIVVAAIAVPALLTMQFLDGSNRPDMSYGVAAAGSLAPVNFITMIAPDIFGSLDWTYKYWGPGYETMAQADWTDRAVNYLFIGTLPAVLLLWHGIAGTRLLARENRFVLAALVAALLFAVGRSTPVFDMMFRLLPGVSLYRRPADATFVLNVAFAFAAAYLLHRYIRDGLPTLRRDWPAVARIALVVTPVLTLAVLVGAALRFSWVADQMTASLGSLALALVFAAICVAGLVTGDRMKRRALAAALLVAATGGELLWRNTANSMNAEPASEYTVYAGLTPTEEMGLGVLQRELAARHAAGAHPRVEMLGLGGAWQNSSMVLQIENTLGYNPLRIADYERAVGPGENAGDPNLRHFPDSFRGYKCRLARMLGIDYLVLDRPIAKLPRHVPRPLATLLYGGEGFYVYKIGPSVPRAYLADRILPIDNADVIATHAVPDFDRTHEALVDDTQTQGLSPALLTHDATAATAAPDVSIASYADNAVAVEEDSASGGLLVLHDLYYPGWEADVDGVATPVVRANILFRGVEVPPGHHRVTFTFRPFSARNLLAAASSILHRGDE